MITETQIQALKNIVEEAFMIANSHFSSMNDDQKRYTEYLFKQARLGIQEAEDMKLRLEGLDK